MQVKRRFIKTETKVTPLNKQHCFKNCEICFEKGYQYFYFRSYFWFSAYKTAFDLHILAEYGGRTRCVSIKMSCQVSYCLVCVVVFYCMSSRNTCVIFVNKIEFLFCMYLRSVLYIYYITPFI